MKTALALIVSIFAGLGSAITPHLAKMQNPKDVHFNGEGCEFLGNQVAAAITLVLRQNRP